MADDNLADALYGFTNYVMNERVRCYNEGVDAERERGLDETELKAAVDAYNAVWQSWSDITAHNVEVCRRAAMTAALNAVRRTHGQETK